MEIIVWEIIFNNLKVLRINAVEDRLQNGNIACCVFENL